MPKKQESLHQRIMDQAYARWQDPRNNWSQAQFMSQLSPIERFAVATGNLNYQVENGGFSQWAYNNYASTETVAFLIRVTLEMGTPASLAVHGLLHAFKARKPNVHAENEDDIEPDYEDLDTAYYKVNAAFMVDCAKHLETMRLGAK